MRSDGDSWSDCKWEAGRVRELVAGFVKSLIQARWKCDPAFLTDDELRRWFRPNGEEVRTDRNSAGHHLRYARRNLRELQTVAFLPDEWGCSAKDIPGPRTAGELVEAVEALLDGGCGEEHPVEAFDRAVDQHRDRPRAWENLIRWSELPLLRTVLDRFPPPPERAPAVTPDWDRVTRVLKYGGRQVRVVGPTATNIVEVLDEFQLNGWFRRIDSPFDSPDTLHDTLKRLRSKLKRITFRMDESGSAVIWEVRKPAQRKRTTK